MSEHHQESPSTRAPEFERTDLFAVRSPFTEVLIDNALDEWTESIKEPVEERAARLPAIQETVHTLLTQKNKSLESALTNGSLSKETTKELYRSLTTIMSDDDYSRIALYVPFDFLNNPDSNDPDLSQVFEVFLEQYTQTWWKLLAYRDKRADFIDGDLPDDRDLPIEMIVKAAHLIPELLDRGVISSEDVEWLIEQSKDDPVLQQSIAEALVPTRAQDSGSKLFGHSEKLESIKSGTASLLYGHELQKTLEREGDIVEGRRLWLAQALLNNVVAELSHQVLTNFDSIGVIEELRSGDYLDRQIALASYERLLIRTDSSLNDLQMFEQALFDDNFAVRTQSILSLRRLCRSGVITREYLKTLGVTLPSMTGRLSENISESTTEELNEKLLLMTNHPELKEWMYPVILIEGSSLKGYGTSESDVDIAMFIKPGVPREQRFHLRDSLTRTLDTHVMELWLDEGVNGTLRVKDFDEFDFNEGDSNWTHTLFQSVWAGNDEVINDLRNRLLMNYFNETDDATRYMHLLRMEQDILQWRLMHKGYARCYPTEPFSESLPDGESVFWDPGYRLLATQLFAEKVFLPKIRK